MSQTPPQEPTEPTEPSDPAEPSEPTEPTERSEFDPPQPFELGAHPFEIGQTENLAVSVEQSESPHPQPEIPALGTFDANLPVGPIDERELLLDIKHWRTGRATRKLGEAISHAYVVLFAVVMGGAMIANVIVNAQVSVAQCEGITCLSSRAVLPWVSVAFAIAVALGASRLFGPVLASAAEGFWLMDAPVRRGKLLGRRLLAVVLVSALIGAALCGLVATLTGNSIPLIVAWLGAGGLAAGASVALAAAQQSRTDSRLVRVCAALFSLVTFAGMMLVVAIAAEWIAPRQLEVGLLIPLVVAGMGAVIGIIAVVVARLRLDRLQRARLTSGGSLVSGLSGAMFALDIGLMNDILTERRCEEIGNVRSARGHSTGLTAIIHRDARRLLRFPRPLLGVLVAVSVPYVLDALGLAVLSPILSAMALFGALVPLLGGLRVFTRSGGMARSLPFSPGQIKRASVVVPAVIAFGWAAATFPAFAGFGESAGTRDWALAMVTAELVAAAGLLGAIRWTIAKPINFSAPMVATQAGALPPGMIGNLVRGFDLCLLITFALVFNLPWFISAGIALICAFVLLGSFNAAEMQYQAEQQRKDMERMKTGRGDRVV